MVNKLSLWPIRRTLIWPMVIIVLSVLAYGMTYADSLVLLRAPVVGAFLILCPGMALVRIIRVADWVAEISVGVALSFGVETIVSLAMLYSGHWSWPVGVLCLVILSIAGAVVQIIRLPKVEQEAPV